jgi:hypothetical protein
MMDRSRALALLALCDGDEIWSLETCRRHGVPPAWIARWKDAFESNPALDRDTIYYGEQKVAQFEGVRAVDLAIELARELGVRLDPQVLAHGSRSRIVQTIRETLEEE